MKINDFGWTWNNLLGLFHIKKTHRKNSQMRSKLQNMQSGMVYTTHMCGNENNKLAAFDILACRNMFGILFQLSLILRMNEQWRFSIWMLNYMRFWCYKILGIQIFYFTDLISFYVNYAGNTYLFILNNDLLN